MKHVDLHTHTRYSDGTSDPRQVVMDAALKGLEAIAITDHDITSGIPEAQDEAREFGIEVVPGVEVSTTKYHILGYGFDIENPVLQDMLRESREYQTETVKKRIEILQSAGIPITYEKVLAAYPHSRLGKMNIIYTMIRDPECIAKLGRLSGDEIFETYLAKGKIGAHVDGQKSIKSRDAINTIHAAGGIAIVAHPFKQAKEASELDRMIDRGIDGIEIQPNYNGRNEPFIEYARQHGLMTTYGSDYHGVVFAHRPMLSNKGNAMEPFWDKVLV